MVPSTSVLFNIRSIPLHISRDIHYQAGQRAAHAKHELGILASTPHFNDFLRHWRNFLEASDDVFEKLKTATKVHPTARQEWRKIEIERKEEPVLLWMWQARNADKHGGKPSVEYVPGRAMVNALAGETIRSSGFHTMPILGIPDVRHTIDFSGIADQNRVKITPAWPRMLDVVDDRFKTIFPVPTNYFHHPFGVPDARAAGHLTMAYVEELIYRTLPRADT